MMKRHEIQVLLKAGLPQAEVARVAGVSERTVRAVREETAVTEVNVRRNSESWALSRSPVRRAPSLGSW